MDNVCEGDMVLINDEKVVNVGYVAGKVNVPYLGVCYNIIEINENGESRHLMAKEKVLECKRLYQDILQESMLPPLIHGINNGYQDW